MAIDERENGMLYERRDQVPLPPKDAAVFTTACDYCVAACGYKVYRWPAGTQGGRAAGENALGVDFPVAPLSGSWISPNMHNVVTANGRKQNVIVLPDPDSKAVNIGGDHSIRGIASSCAFESSRTTTSSVLIRGSSLRSEPPMLPPT